MKRVEFLLFSLVIIGFSILGIQSAKAQGSTWSKKPTWSAVQQQPQYIQKDSSRVRKSLLKRDSSPFSPGSHNASLDIGQVFLMGDLAESYADNLGLQLHYTYGVSDIFGFDTSIGYSSHTDGDFSMLSWKSGVRANLAWFDKIIPYVSFGLGFYRPSYQISKNATMAPILFGLHLGPGVTLNLTDQLFFGTSLTFHDIFGGERESATGIVQDVGGSYTSFLLHAGTSF